MNQLDVNNTVIAPMIGNVTPEPITTGEIQPGIWRSRWGYHPCDYETFRLVKKLRGLYEEAKRQYAANSRWGNKLEKNRQGTEPTTSKIFVAEKWYYYQNSEGRTLGRYQPDDLGILETRQRVKPVANLEDVKPLLVSKERILELLTLAQ